MSTDYLLPVSNAAVVAAGQAIRGMGIAIQGLSRLGMKDEAKELATQMLWMSKSLGFLLREDRAEIKAKASARKNGTP